MDASITGPAELAPAPPAADMRYTDDTVTRVLVRVERADGRVREYEAREPQDFQMNDPESLSSMVTSKSRGALPAGGGFVPLTRAVSSVRLSFTAHPRWNLHIRTERTATPAERPVTIRAEAEEQFRDCEEVTDRRGKTWRYSEPQDVWTLMDPETLMAVHRSACSWRRLQTEFGPLVSRREKPGAAPTPEAPAGTPPALPVSLSRDPSPGSPPPTA